MLADNIIETSQTEWVSPIGFESKAEGSFQIFVDFRKLNASIKRDLLPISRMNQCTDSLGVATIFLSHNANSGYGESK